MHNPAKHLSKISIRVFYIPAVTFEIHKLPVLSGTTSHEQNRAQRCTRIMHAREYPEPVEHGSMRYALVLQGIVCLDQTTVFAFLFFLTSDRSMHQAHSHIFLLCLPPDLIWTVISDEMPIINRDNIAFEYDSEEAVRNK